MHGPTVDKATKNGPKMKTQRDLRNLLGNLSGNTPDCHSQSIGRKRQAG
jgi:hypothetical protein